MAPRLTKRNQVVMNLTTYVPITLTTYDIGQNFVNPKFDRVVFENELYTYMI